jgi:hypothetical protein
MAILANPASYLTAAAFKAMPLDYDISSYTDAQLQDVLVRATGFADAIMRKTWLYRERVIRLFGDGTNRLEIHETPLLYIKKVQIVIPGSSGPLIPVDQILIDYTSGGLLEYTPMLWQGQGYFAVFPHGVPIDITVGTGYGFVYSPPVVTLADTSGPGLAPGAYNIAVTTKTMSGETSATIRQFTTATGSIQATIAPTLGGYLYRAYVSNAANNTTLTAPSIVGTTSFTVASAGTIAPGDVLLFGANTPKAEYLTVATASGTSVTTTTGALNAHASADSIIPRPMLSRESPFTAYGMASLSVTVSALAPTGYWQDAFPLTDSSSPTLPSAITEATRLLALMQLYEQNNLANRGVYELNSGKKRLVFKSTQGTSGRGIPLMAEQAAAILRPYSFQGMT